MTNLNISNIFLNEKLSKITWKNEKFNEIKKLMKKSGKTCQRERKGEKEDDWKMDKYHYVCKGE